MSIKNIALAACASVSFVLISGCAGGYLSEDRSAYTVHGVQHNSALTDFKTHHHSDPYFYHHMRKHHTPHYNRHYHRPYYDGYHYYGWTHVPNRY